MKKILITTLALTAPFALFSCVSPHSTDPVGDAFTNASNSIGNVVNKVVPPVPPAKPTTAPPSYTIPATN